MIIDRLMKTKAMHDIEKFITIFNVKYAINELLYNNYIARLLDKWNRKQFYGFSTYTKFGQYSVSEIIISDTGSTPLLNVLCTYLDYYIDYYQYYSNQYNDLMNNFLLLSYEYTKYRMTHIDILYPSFCLNVNNLENIEDRDYHKIMDYLIKFHSFIDQLTYRDKGMSWFKEEINEKIH